MKPPFFHKAVVAIAFLVFCGNAFADEAPQWKRDLVRQFCEALQAQSVCDDVSMRMDTRARVMKLIGEDFEATDSQYKSDCDAAYDAWDYNRELQLCAAAKLKYDCNGTVQPGLLQDDPFGNKNGEFCRF